MKNIIFGGAGMTVIVLVSVILLSVAGRGIRSHELNIAVARAVKNTVETGYERAQTEGNSASLKEEMTAYLGQEIINAVQSEAAVQIEVLEMELEKGIVSARVTEGFLYPNGKQSEVSVTKTAIADREGESEARNYTVKYYVDGSLYKEYSICGGDPLIVPADPSEEGKRFAGWIVQEGGAVEADAGRTVEGDYEFRAVFEE